MKINTDIYYLVGEEPEESGTWEEYILFMSPFEPEPGVGDKILLVGYAGEGWSTLKTNDDWAIWGAQKPPNRYWIKAVFQKM